jgi:predicted permease
MFSRGSASSFALDVKHALRGLLRRPGYALSSVLTFAFGIGAVVAMFSVVYSVLIRPLPYANPDDLVRVRHRTTSAGNEIFTSSTMYLTYREHNRSFEHFGLWQEGTQNLTGSDNPEQLRRLAVTAGTLQALGVQPTMGRWFTADEHEPGAVDAEPVILSYRFWQRRFGADESPLGLEFELDSARVRVVGVMPRDFRFLDMEPQPDVIRAVRIDPATAVIGAFTYQSLGRLRRGVTAAQASADLERMLPIWLAEWPTSPGGLTRQVIADWRLTPIVSALKDDLTKTVAGTLWMFMGTIGFVLLISCANVANLMLLRAAARRQEFSVRTALGAVPQRIARTLLTEGAAIGALGGVLGLFFAWLGLRVVVELGPRVLPRLGDASLYPPVIAFAVASTLLSVLAFVSVAVLKTTATSKLSIPSNARGASSGRDDSLTRNTLVVAQVALVLALVVSAALMGRSLQALLAVDAGFSRPGTVQTARTTIAPAVIPETDRFTVVQREILDRIAAIPGVSSAAIASAVPMDGRFNAGPLHVDAAVAPIDETAYSNRFKWVSPGYFATMGTRIVAGRDISWADIDDGGHVAVISERLAGQLSGDPAGAIGQRIRVTSEDAWREVVGVAQDVYEDGLYGNPPSTVYRPMRMDSFFNSDVFGQRDIAYVMRSDRAGTAALLDEVRERVWSVNGSIPVFAERTLRDLYADSLARTSFATAMLAIASALALTVGVVGIYGVMSHVVARRTPEIGIRSALGAEPRQLARMFLLHGLRLSGVGAVLGLVMAAALGRLMSSLLFGIEPLDLVAYAAAVGAMLFAAALASYLPARRAAKIDPMHTLRSE